jgi:[glutamine synthetase] adenylyltransferase / [glutamine synthetase]-adenylyl-L-tyrosine phosphorylase
VTPASDAIARAEAHSPYIRRLMTRMPSVTSRLVNEEYWGIVPDIDSTIPVGRALRRAKSELALTVAIGDLAGILSLDEVMAHLSNFADRSLGLALAAAFEAVVPDCAPTGISIIALGKHGNFELNYSSDIDPILIFDPQTLPVRRGDEPIETAVRIARKMVAIMQDRDEAGYVFRVDLRLRPNPEISPIILPVAAAISHYESSALPWERAAFIRARVCGGDKPLGDAFLTAIQPFIWRRALDFGAVEDIRMLTHRIRDHHAKGQIFGLGYDLKRGRGGIRECEFFAQIHQLIHGGRAPALRTSSTLGALQALADAGRIDPEHAQMVGEAYRLYRVIEHRLQMVEDQQTHSLPTSDAALNNVACLHGLENGDALLALLETPVEQVGQIYDGLDRDAESNLPRTASTVLSWLSDAGFPNPESAADTIAKWRSGSLRAIRSAPALAALDSVLPGLIKSLGGGADPMHAINRLATLIERLPSALNLFRLLDAQPALLRLLTNILVHAPALADQLATRPELLDHLIDASAFDPPGSVADLLSELSISDNLEAQLDHVRRRVGDHRFALGVQIIEGTSDPLNVAAGYARIAEAAIRVVAASTIAAFESAHGTVPGCELVILALGRMGGAELTHASDLDLVYLFTGRFDGESEGPKPLGAVLYFNRLAQRVTAGLSVPTAAGPLYEIDTRLRPSGAKGPLSVSLEGFRRYQLDEAWTWEHMALTRARVVFGSVDAAVQTESIVGDVLHSPHDEARLVADAAKMRADIRAYKPPLSDLDVKLIDGGLVDLEFAVHVLQLRHCQGLQPRLSLAIQSLVSAKFLPASSIEAHAFMTRLLVALRLVAPTLEAPDVATRALIARACGFKNWSKLLEALTRTRQDVSSILRSVLAADLGAT